MTEVVFKVGDFTLHPRRQLSLAGMSVPIGRKALDLLSLLAESRGDIVTKDALVARVWARSVVEERAVRAQITALRKVLGRDAANLKTVRGVGYKLAEVERSHTDFSSKG